MTDIKSQGIQFFLAELASQSPAPGGGSVAALMGAQGAALVSMVCNLTLGKPKFAEVETEMRAVLNQAEALCARLTDLAQQDIDVFNRLMAQYALPKTTDEEKAVRSTAIQSVLQNATQVPLNCAKACAEVIALSQIAADKGNPNVISDAGAALMAAYSAIKISALNVTINAASLHDKSLAEAKLAELESVLVGLEANVAKLYAQIKAKL